MSRVQVKFVLAGLSLVALLLLFPHWVARHDEGGTRGLGYAWIGTPPDPVDPDDHRPGDLSGFTADDRRRMAELWAASYGAPEIDWWIACGRCGFIVVYFAIFVVVFRKTSVLKKSRAEDVFS